MSTGCSVINLGLQVGTKMRSRKGRNGWLVINIQDVYPMVQYWHKTKFISCLPFSSLLCVADLLVRIVLHNYDFQFQKSSSPLQQLPFHLRYFSQLPPLLLLLLLPGVGLAGWVL